jgi:PKD repeat protein
VVRISNGQQTVTVERITANVQWAERNFRIRDFITPTANMTVSFIAVDDAAVGHLVEGGVDYFRITDTNTVVNIPPVAEFSATNTTGCGPLSVSFSDASTGSPTSWLWTFTGGTPATSTSQNPTVVYNAPGTYAVTLRATNQFGNNTITKQSFVTVQPPVADFTADAVSGCPGLRVSFNDITTCNQSNRVWTFPGGSPATSTQANPQVIYNAVGQYDVTLTSGGVTITKPNFITVTSGGNIVVLNENFESGFATNGWAVENPDNGITWQLGAANGNPPGTQAAYVQHYNYQTVGQRDRLVSKSLDLSNVQNASLTFKHAHRRYIAQQGQTPQNRDSLIVYASSNNGVTWNRILSAAENGQGSFATNGSQVAEFIPAVADDWCFSGTVGAPCFTLSLAAYDGLPNVRLRFETYNDYGNNTFLDDVVVSGICASNPIGPIANYSASPTSACGSLTVNFTDASVNNPTSWEWTFAGGTPATSTAQNPTVTYNTPGNYPVKLKVSNTNGSDSLTIQNYISVNDFPTINLVTENISCFGLNNGSVAVDITNNVGSVQYLWSNGATTATINNLSVGSYSVTVTTAANCTATTQTTITEPTELLLSVNKTDADCNLSNGSAEATVSGGVQPYLYDWSNGATSAIIDNLAGGNYEVIVVDNSGCTKTEQIVISNGNAPTATVNVNLISCYGLSDGSIDVSVSGGNPPYGYSWSTGDNTSNLQGLASGTYLLTVTDQSGCFETVFIAVSEPDSLYVELEVNNIACGNKFGSILAIPFGGTTPYNYDWSNTASNSLNDFLEEGSYSVTVTDDNNCSATTQATITESLDSLVVDVTTTPDNGSGNGTATLSISSGVPPYQYLWNNGASTSNIVGLTAGTYYVTVVDASNCSSVDTVTIDLSNSINDIVLNEVLVYPNPSLGKLFIAVANEQPISDISISDVLGKQIKFTTKKISAVEYDIDISENANGVYIISFNFNNRIYSKRIVLTM